MIITPPSSSVHNILVNPGQEIWQRGNGPFTTDGAYGPDGWQVDRHSDGTGTLTLTKETSTLAGNGLASAKIVASVSTGFLDFQQKIENWQDLRGQTWNFSIAISTAAPSALRAWVWSDSGFVFSPYHPGDGQFHVLDATTTWPGGTVNGFYVGIAVSQNATVYVDNAMAVPGSAVVPYYPLNEAQEWTRALRWYEHIGGNNAGSSTFGLVYRFVATATSQTLGQVWPYQVRKAALPTVTISGSWNTSLCGQWSDEGLQSLDAMATFVTTTGAGNGFTYSGSTSANFTADASP